MDDLDARLRGLRPTDSSRFDPLPARAQQHLVDTIHGIPQVRHARSPRRSLVFVTAAAVLVIAVAVFGIFRWDAPPAQALTPPPLKFANNAQDLRQVVEDAMERLNQNPGPEVAVRGTNFVGWFAQVDMDASSEKPVAIAPEVVSLQWNEDLSASQIVTAGEAYWADPSRRGPVDGTASAGTVLSETVFGPGEFAVPSSTVPGDTREDIEALLASLGGSATGVGAGDVMESIDSAFGLWTLTNAQHAILLRLLLEAGDVQVLGSTTDRAGRLVVGLSAEPHSFPGTARVLLISADTGRIVGIETLRTTAEPPFKRGDVVAYKLWEVPH